MNATRLVDRDRAMFTAFENRAHQPREFGIGAYFEKRPRAHPIHGFNLRDEFDGASELTGQ